MAGERLAKLTIQASFAADDSLRADQTYKQSFRLLGLWRDYYRGFRTAANQNYYEVPDPDDVGRAYVQQAVDNLLPLLRLDIQSRGIPYLVSASRDMGDDLVTHWPKIEFDIEATQYATALNLDFQDFNLRLPKGWTVLQNLTTLMPITVQAGITPAGIYGSATGGISLLATVGNRHPFTYLWNDGATGANRYNLVAGTYTCVVKDQDGVSTSITCVVTSDAQLQVVVQQTETTIDLAISGGVGPYAVVWDDGPTGPSRAGLSAGTYYATVTDSKGASLRVSVVLRPNRCYFSQNPVRLPLDAGAAYRLDPTTKPNLSFVAEVWVEPEYLSGVYVQAGPTLEQPADLAGRTVFDVQALLDAYVAEHLPALDGPGIERAELVFKRFYLKSAEKYGTPPVPAPLSTAPVNFVLCGGLSQEEAAAGNWPDYQAAVRPFLTWEPDNQRVLPQQPAYLYYQHLDGEMKVLFWVRVQHTDGTKSQYVLQRVNGVRRWEVYCLNVSPAPRGLTGVDVVGYEVWVSSEAGVPLSATRRFVLERAYYPQPRFFVYSNSLGGANVLAALGAAKRTLEVKAEQAERPSYDPDLGDVATLDRLGTPTLSIDTGPRLRRQVDADQELLLSRRVSLLKDGRYWPGTVVAATFTVRNENEGLTSLAFDFALARQRRFSPRLPLVLAGQPTTPVAGGEGGTP